MNRSLLVLFLALVCVFAVLAKGGQETTSTSKQAITLRVLARHGPYDFPEGQDANDNEWVNYINEVTGYSIEWTFVEGEQLPLIIASGDTPDIFFVTPGPQTTDFYSQGILADITDHLKSAPNLMREVPELAWKQITFDGRIYGIPNTWVAPVHGWLVRTDWMKNLDASPPQDKDQLYELLRAFTREDPDQNGREDTFGLITDGASPMHSGNPLMWGLFELQNEFLDMDGGVVYTPTHARAKEMLAYIRKLYGEGILDREFMINKGQNISEKVVGGKAGSIAAWYWTARPYIQGVKEKAGEEVLQYLKPPQSVLGKDFRFTQFGPMLHNVGISADSPHVKEAVDWCNRMWDEEIAMNTHLGFEGVHRRTKSDGGIEFLPAFKDIVWKWYYTDNIMYHMRIGLITEDHEWLDTKVPQYQWVGGDETWNVISLLPAREEYGKLINDLRDYTQESYIKFITGEQSLDEFGAYADEWLEKGGQKILDWLNAEFSQ